MGYLKVGRSDHPRSTYRIYITQWCARMLRLLTFFLVLLTSLIVDYPAFSASLKGYGKVIDGDSLVVNGKSIRLAGIDAPEAVQWCHDAKGIDYRCGVMATAWLINATSGRQGRCEWMGKDRYKRLLSTCFVGVLNLNAGWSVAYRKFSMEYVPEENAARSAKRGLWAGRFKMPWIWRAETRANSGTPSLQMGKPSQELRQGCCKLCKSSKACGNACIRKTSQCTKAPGCACDDL